MHTSPFFGLDEIKVCSQVGTTINVWRGKRKMCILPLSTLIKISKQSDIVCVRRIIIMQRRRIQ